ncbi:hypothetical protein A2U01_0089793, partial [Trifolium medium]|nr:hypothetical protein [Trifolium medium]
IAQNRAVLYRTLVHIVPTMDSIVVRWSSWCQAVFVLVLPSCYDGKHRGTMDG